MQVQCSDGQTRHVDDQALADVTELAARLDLDPADLDDVVHDCCDATASNRVNNDTELPENLEEGQDVAYDDAGATGSRVNNDGVDAQVAFLLAELGADQARATLTAASAQTTTR